MGAGKSTVGPRLAQKLGWTFRDLDAWIEERHGLPVSEIFAQKGEAAFREEELRGAEEARGLDAHVLAAGGGAFAQDPTRAALQEGAVTVWLRCTVDRILSRLAGDTSRPLAGDRERMSALLASREPYYRLADLTVDTTDREPEAVADEIVASLFPGREGRGGTER